MRGEGEGAGLCDEAEGGSGEDRRATSEEAVYEGGAHKKSRGERVR